MKTIIKGSEKLEKLQSVYLNGVKVKVVNYYSLTMNGQWLYCGQYYVPYRVADKDLLEAVSDQKFTEKLKENIEK